MNKQEFLKKWLPVVEHGLKVSKNTFKIDLELLLMSENQTLQNVIDRQAEDLMENQGHTGNDHVTDSPFCFPNFIKYGNNFGIKRLETFDIEPRFAPERPDNQLIVDCDYPPETLTTKTYSVSGSINKTVKVPEDKFDSLLEALKKCPDKRVEL